MPYAVLAVFLVEMNDGFGIAVCAIAMAASDQILPQGAMIVDFAVEDDPDGTIFIADRLMSTRNVDDAETAHAEPDPALREESVIIGTAVRHDVAHVPQSARIGLRPFAKFKYSCNATHAVYLS